MIVFIATSCIDSNRNSSNSTESDESSANEMEPVREIEKNNNTIKETDEFEQVEKEPTEEEIVEELIENMSLEEKIGQLIIGGFTGTTITKEVKQLIHTYKLGGFILFRSEERRVGKEDRVLWM